MGDAVAVWAALVNTTDPRRIAVAQAPGNATGNRLPFAQDFVGTLAINYAKALGNVNTASTSPAPIMVRTGSTRTTSCGSRPMSI